MPILGHDVHYATYWGQTDPLSLIPDGRRRRVHRLLHAVERARLCLGNRAASDGALTVIGGPHARSFPTDCARFFDIVVKDCDRNLIDDILRSRFDPPAIVSSGRALKEFPSVEERMPEIRVAAFHRGRPVLTSVVPMLSSIGCPYTCGFCVDWNSQYVTLPAGAAARRSRLLSRHYPKLVIAYHDPNFAVRFDETMDVLARVPKGRRNPYIMESSLSILKGERMTGSPTPTALTSRRASSRGSTTRASPGRAARKGREKLEKIVAQLEELSRHVPGIQANFLFGCDYGRRRGAGRTDQGIHQAPAAGLAHDQHPQPLRRHAALRRAAPRRTHPGRRCPSRSTTIPISQSR